MTIISGSYDGRPVTLEVQGDQITRPTGASLLLAAKAQGAIRAGASMDIPGIWRGPATLTDPWGLRALFLELLDPGTARFEGDDPPSLGPGDDLGTQSALKEARYDEELHPRGRAGRWIHKMRSLEQLATDAHRGQTDLQGRDYMDHVRSVAGMVHRDAQPVAMMHDALEDTRLTSDDLAKVLSPDELKAVELLTRGAQEHGSTGAYERYIERLAAAGGKPGELAREVKRADLRSNLERMTPELRARRPDLSPRYETALKRLSWDTPGGQALTGWTGARSHEIQAGYKDGVPQTDLAKRFDTGLNAIPPTRGATLYRGMNVDLPSRDPEQVAEHYRAMIGTTLSVDHPESASTVPQNMEKLTLGPQARVVYEIRSDRGRHIAPYASHREAWEAETVLPPGRFTVTGAMVREFPVTDAFSRDYGGVMPIAVVQLRDVTDGQVQSVAYMPGDKVRIRSGLWAGQRGTVEQRADPSLAWPPRYVVQTETSIASVGEHEMMPEADSFQGEGLARELGDLPIPIGPVPEHSAKTPEELRSYGDALRAEIKRHPQVLEGNAPLSAITFLSDPRWDRARTGLNDAGALLATATTPARQQLLIINDSIDLRRDDVRAGAAEILAPADATPEGLMTHELGHVLANSAGMGTRTATKGDIGPEDAAKVSRYAASDPSEAFAEMYAQQMTTGHQIKDPELRAKFLALVKTMEETIRTVHGETGGPIIATSPQLQAEIDRAAAENIAAGKWVAQTPELDKLRALLQQ